jgi:uncharacterized membrane protein YedE/YeeE
MERVSEFLVGLLFGVGLILAGMTDPAKVIGFLDLAGAWDPSLAFVMGGAMQLPTSRDIDRRLIGGSVMFGAGWGLAGFCPGPALVSVGAGQSKAIVFTIAMLLGLVIFEMLERRRLALAAAH